MFTVTDAAGAHLAEIIKIEAMPEDVAIRFVNEEQGLGMQPDNEKPGDATFQHEGRTILLLDSQIAELLTGSVLDMDGDRLTLLRPNEEAPSA